MKEYYFQTVEREERFFVYKNRDEYQKHRKKMERFGFEVKRNMGIEERVDDRKKIHDLYGDIEVHDSTDLMGVKGMYFYRAGYYREQLVEKMETL
ncbi:hypothetical protein [Bacillus pseudomycoides]|uniref:hypothetical protein n=1 Tax=Bacillus pseudomycoides TaxID=64104 RepID=UPI000BF23E3B|nr:hypothetical protein [Bacillus pseudomycoides]PEN09686.1 hypothetical protein CN640_11600 [Bacillus pseudomycoides]